MLVDIKAELLAGKIDTTKKRVDIELKSNEFKVCLHSIKIFGVTELVSEQAKYTNHSGPSLAKS